MAATLGIVGAIASGKSTVARWFEARGWSVVDADVQAHALYAPGSGLVKAMESRFGSGILREDGAVDRAALGKIVFEDPKALADLDALVHPLARARIRSAMDQALEREENVALEMALLYRWPEMVARLDRILGIQCSDSTRLERLVARSGLTREEASARLDVQDQPLILAPARIILDNDGSLGDLEALLAKI